MKTNLETIKKRLLERILNQIVAKFSADVGTIHQLGADNILHLIAHTNNIPAFIVEKTNEIPVGKGIAGTTAQKRTPTVIKNLSGEVPHFVMAPAKTVGMGGCVCVPIFSDSQVVGTISLGYNYEYEFTKQQTQDLTEMLSKENVVDLLRPQANDFDFTRMKRLPNES